MERAVKSSRSGATNSVPSTPLAMFHLGLPAFPARSNPNCRWHALHCRSPRRKTGVDLRRLVPRPARWGGCRITGNYHLCSNHEHQSGAVEQPRDVKRIRIASKSPRNSFQTSLLGEIRQMSPHLRQFLVGCWLCGESCRSELLRGTVKCAIHEVPGDFAPRPLLPNAGIVEHGFDSARCGPEKPFSIMTCICLSVVV